MEVKALKIKNLRNEEHFKFNLEFSELVAQYTSAALGIELKYPPYLASFEKERQALNIVQASTITDALNDADMLRDNLFAGLVKTVQGALSHYDPAVKGAANHLGLLLDQYGNVSIKPYDQETASIIRLVEELEVAYAPDVAKLGIAGWVTQLKAQNLAFDTLKKQRYDENTIKPQQNLKEARLETDACYRAVVKCLEALMEINGDTAYAPFVNALNERIENYQNVLAQRQARNAKDEEEGGTEGGEGELKK